MGKGQGRVVSGVRKQTNIVEADMFLLIAATA